MLLALSIALMPVLNVSVASAEHPESMLMHCVDCDLAEVTHDASCKNLDCSTIVQSCGLSTGAGYLPVSSLAEIIPSTHVINPGRNRSEYRQNVTEPIYRPPIA